MANAPVDARALEASLRPHGESVMLPREAYTDPAVLAWERRHFEEKLSAGLRNKLPKSDACTLDQYIAAQKVLIECRRLLEVAFGDLDALLVPSAPGEAPKGLTSTGDSVFNADWTALHTPAVTVPVFTGPAGLPIGAQLVGAYGADYKTLACADWAFRALS